MRTIRTITQLASMWGIDTTGMSVHEIDKAISRQVYKYTGSWSKLDDSFPSYSGSVQVVWLVDIRITIAGWRIYRARKTTSSHWIKPKYFPQSLLEYLLMDGELTSLPYTVTDAETIETLNQGRVGIRFTDGHKRRKYHRVSIRTPLAEIKPQTCIAITFGSIVEDSDAEATPETVKLPADEQEIWKALDNVTAHAAELWEMEHEKDE